MDCVDISCSGISEDGNKDVLLYVKRPGVECKLKFPVFEEYSISDRYCQELAKRNHRDLGGDGGDGERFSTVPKELVEKRKEEAS